MRKRSEGFLACLRAQGLEADEGLCQYVPFTIEGGYEGTLRLLRGPRRPTALFAANNGLTLGAMMALGEMGLRVPDDVSLIGFDNRRIAQVLRPSLTMVVQPMEAIAAAAAELLLSRLGGKAPLAPRLVKLDAELVQGGSVLRLPVTTAGV